MILIIDFASLIGGACFAIGLILWLILIIFGNGIADQGIVVGNLFSSTLFLIGAIIRIVRFFKDGAKRYKILGIISCIAIIASMIYGYFVPYNNLVFHYSYERWASVIHTTWLVSMIINILELIFVEKEVPGAFYGSIVLIISGLFLGNFLTMGLWLFTGVDNTRNIYDRVCYYDNRNYINDKKDQFESPLEMANYALEEYKKDLKENDKKISGEYISDNLNNNSNFREKYLNTYGYDCRECTQLLTNNLKYTIVDLQKEEKYVLFFDSSKNKFTEYNKDNVIKIENEIAKNLENQFKEIAKELVEKDLSGYNASEYISDNYFEGYNVTIGYIDGTDSNKKVEFKKSKSGNTTFTVIINPNNLKIVSSDYKLTEGIY